MADRMDQLVAMTVRQGFQVWQTRKGGWVFRKGIVNVTATKTPETAGEWLALIGALKGTGLEFPDGE